MPCNERLKINSTCRRVSAGRCFILCEEIMVFSGDSERITEIMESSQVMSGVGCKALINCSG